MNFLFVLDGVSYPAAANLQLAGNLTHALHDKGHQITILYMTGDADTQKAFTPYAKVIPMIFANEAKMERILEHGASGGTPKFLRLAKLALHPGAAVAAVQHIVLKGKARRKACINKIEQLCAASSYDGVCAVCAPFSVVEILLNSHITARKVIWQMDPLGDNPSAQEGDVLALEKRILKEADEVFCTQSNLERYLSIQKEDNISAHLTVFPFPCFVPNLGSSVEAISQRSPSRIRITFCGGLYPTLRTPHYALQLFSSLARSDFELCFIGGGWENYPPDLITNAKAIMEDRLIITGRISPTEAKKEIAKADFLLNLGNENTNQIPSKIFEYFASCKPIITLAKRQDDSSLTYLEKYPLSLILVENQLPLKEASDLVERFISENYQKRADLNTVRQTYLDFTPQQAAEIWLNEFSRMEQS